MNITIEIDCTDKTELLLHLRTILEEIEKREFDEPDEVIEFEDNNCYGTHSVFISPEEN